MAAQKGNAIGCDPLKVAGSGKSKCGSRIVLSTGLFFGLNPFQEIYQKQDKQNATAESSVGDLVCALVRF